MTRVTLLACLAMLGTVGASARDFHQDFTKYQTKNERLRVVDSGKPDFPKALEITSVKIDGKTHQGKWNANLDLEGAVQIRIAYQILFRDRDARYAILANDGTSKAITVIQDGNRFKVAKNLNGSWLDAGPVTIGKWHDIQYDVDFLAGMYSVSIDGQCQAKDIPFRESSVNKLTRIWILGSESADSCTLLGSVHVTALPGNGNAFAKLAARPYSLCMVPWCQNAPKTAADFQKAVPLYLQNENGEAQEPASVRLMRDSANLYAFFDLSAKEMALRKDEATARDSRCWINDCFELFLQPLRSKAKYVHFVGNSSGAIYDAMHEEGKRNNDWNCNWQATLGRSDRGWTALVRIPFAALGGVPAANSIWGFNAGRENPHVHDVLSWTGTDSFHRIDCFGKLIFTAPDEDLNNHATIQKLFWNIFQLGERRDKLAAALVIPAQETADTPATIPAQRKRLQNEFADWNKRLAEARNMNSFLLLDAELRMLMRRTDALAKEIKWYADIFRNPDIRQKGYAGLAFSSMTKLVEGDSSFLLENLRDVNLLLSGRETGAFQIVLTTLPGKGVEEARLQVEIPGLNAKTSTYLEEFIRTAMPVAEQHSYADALRPGKQFQCGGRNVAAFWVDVQVPAGTPAGKYAGKAIVTLPGRGVFEQPFQIETTGLDLPEKTTLDTAFCFAASWLKDFAGKLPATDVIDRYWQLIADHRLEPMNLWSALDVGADHLDYCAAHGKRMLFLNVFNIRQKEAQTRAIIEKYKGRLEPMFFGHDEVLLFNDEKKIAEAKRDYFDAKELFPNVRRMNTAPVDERFFGVIDIWCPLFNAYEPATAQARLALGEQVWWYPTDYPLAPYANFNLNSPGIDPRIIPWMNWKLGITGLLYWGLNREWRSNGSWEAEQITDGFRKQRGLDWMTPEVQQKMKDGSLRWPDIPWLPYFRSVFNTQSVSKTNGGGNLMYPGPNWEPWPSLRLKNLRDGLQDYEYFAMLRQKAASLRKQGKNAMADQCDALLKLDDKVVAGKESYTKNPQELLDFREKLIRTLMKP